MSVTTTVRRLQPGDRLIPTGRVIQNVYPHVESGRMNVVLTDGDGGGPERHVWRSGTTVSVERVAPAVMAEERSNPYQPGTWTGD